MTLAEELKQEREAFDKMTDEEKYLDWFNNWLSIASMAKYYNKSEEEIMDSIHNGKQQHYRNNQQTKNPQRKIIS